MYMGKNYSFGWQGRVGGTVDVGSRVYDADECGKVRTRAGVCVTWELAVDASTV
jgi:hypothetical protein